MYLTSIINHFSFLRIHKDTKKFITDSVIGMLLKFFKTLHYLKFIMRPNFSWHVAPLGRDSAERCALLPSGSSYSSTTCSVDWQPPPSVFWEHSLFLFLFVSNSFLCSLSLSFFLLHILFSLPLFLSQCRGSSRLNADVNHLILTWWK